MDQTTHFKDICNKFLNNFLKTSGYSRTFLIYINIPKDPKVPGLEHPVMDKKKLSKITTSSKITFTISQLKISNFQWEYILNLHLKFLTLN